MPTVGIHTHRLIARFPTHFASPHNDNKLSPKVADTHHCEYGGHTYYLWYTIATICTRHFECMYRYNSCLCQDDSAILFEQPQSNSLYLLIHLEGQLACFVEHLPLQSALVSTEKQTNKYICNVLLDKTCCVHFKIKRKKKNS